MVGELTLSSNSDRTIEKSKGVTRFRMISQLPISITWSKSSLRWYSLMLLVLALLIKLLKSKVSMPCKISFKQK
jgi:hypothetical protein